MKMMIKYILIYNGFKMTTIIINKAKNRKEKRKK